MAVSRQWLMQQLQTIWRWVLQHPRIALACLAAGIGLQIFAEVLEELYQGELSPIDLAILAHIKPYRAPWLDYLSYALSTLVIWPAVLVLVAPFILYLLITRRFRVLVGTLLTLAVTFVVVWSLKLLIGRDRPLTAYVTEIGHSFPSGHATGSMVLYGLLGYLALRYWVRSWWARLLVIITTLLLIIATGLARIYLQVHYPSDVLAGWSAGAFLLFAGIILLETWAADKPVTVASGS